MIMSSDEESSATKRSVKLKVLCAEDDESLAAMVKYALERAGHEVECVTDGLEALMRLRPAAQAYDVVLTDHEMPNRHGIQLVEELRGLGFSGRIIVHSSSLTRPLLDQYRRLGVHRILSKPAKLEELVNAVEEAA